MIRLNANNGVSSWRPLRLSIVVVLVASVSCGGCQPTFEQRSEVPQCNDPKVKEVMVRRFVPFRQKLIESLTEMKNPSSEAAIKILTNLETDVIRIRQQGYSKENNVRYCAGSLANKGLPSLSPQETAIYSTAIMAALMHSGQTNPSDCGDDRGGTTYYKIEPLLDKQGEFVVSWRCIPW